jgi:hypothetical protein
VGYDIQTDRRPTLADAVFRDRFRVAACQMTATENKDHNRDVAGRLVRTAHADGAESDRRARIVDPTAGQAT